MSRPPRKHPDDVELEYIYELLTEIKRTLDTHITEENIYKPKVIELVDILDRSKGVVWFVKYTAAFLIAGCGFVYWIRDHFKW